MCDLNNIKIPSNQAIGKNIYLERLQFLERYQNDQIRRNHIFSEEKELTQNERELKNISSEIKQLKQDEFLDYKRRQQLRDNCEELRLLERQLHLAQVSKELNNRMKELYKEKNIAENARREGRIRAEKDRLAALEDERLKESKRRQVKEMLRTSLLDQINENHKKRLKDYQEVMNDRNHQIDLQQKIEDEDKQKALEIKQYKIRSRNEMIEFLNLQKIIKNQMKVEKDKEDAKYIQNQNESDDLKKALKQKKLNDIKEFQDKCEKLGEKVFEIEEEKRQRQVLILDLLQQEHKVKADQRFRESLEKQNLERMQARQELSNFRNEMQNKAELKKINLKEANILARKIDSKNDVLLEEKDQQQEVRRKRIQHGHDLLSMIEDNNRKRALEVAENVHFKTMQSKAEHDRQQVIEEERIKMLKALPTDVLRYLPNGVLKESDFKHIALQPPMYKN